MTDNFRDRTLSVNPIDFLEHGGGHFMLRRGGVLIPMPDPREKHYQWVLTALGLRFVPGTPDDVPPWLVDRIFERWAAAWDLPDFQVARRLAYLVDHYRPAISNDLTIYAHHDLGDLWRARRWTLLADLIDRLPAHSHYASAVSMDEEHARMLAEQLASRDEEEKGDRGPALTTWTPEVGVLTSVLDAVRRVEHAVYAAQHGKKAGEPPKPLPRPVTPLEAALKRAQHERRKAKHEALVARVLPQKAAIKG